MNSLSKQSIGLLDEPGFIGAKQVQISSSSPRTSCALQEKCEGIENSKDVHLNRRKLSKLDKCKYLRRMKVKHELKHRIGMKSHLMINNFFSAIRGGIETAGMSSVSTFGSLQCSGLKINSISADGKKEMNENLDNSSEINANCFRKVLSRDKENLTNNNDCTSQAEQRNRNISARLPMNATFCRNCSDVYEVSTHGCSNFEGVQSKPCIFSVEKLHPEGKLFNGHYDRASQEELINCKAYHPRRQMSEGKTKSIAEQDHKKCEEEICSYKPLGRERLSYFVKRSFVGPELNVHEACVHGRGRKEGMLADKLDEKPLVSAESVKAHTVSNHCTCTLDGLSSFGMAVNNAHPLEPDVVHSPQYIVKVGKEMDNKENESTGRNRAELFLKEIPSLYIPVPTSKKGHTLDALNDLHTELGSFTWIFDDQMIKHDLVVSSNSSLQEKVDICDRCIIDSRDDEYVEQLDSKKKIRNLVRDGHFLTHEQALEESTQRYKEDSLQFDQIKGYDVCTGHEVSGMAAVLSLQCNEHSRKQGHCPRTEQYTGTERKTIHYSSEDTIVLQTCHNPAVLDSKCIPILLASSQNHPGKDGNIKCHWQYNNNSEDISQEEKVFLQKFFPVMSEAVKAPLLHEPTANSLSICEVPEEPSESPETAKKLSSNLVMLLTTVGPTYSHHYLFFTFPSSQGTYVAVWFLPKRLRLSPRPVSAPAKHSQSMQTLSVRKSKTSVSCQLHMNQTFDVLQNAKNKSLTIPGDEGVSIAETKTGIKINVSAGNSVKVNAISQDGSVARGPEHTKIGNAVPGETRPRTIKGLFAPSLQNKCTSTDLNNAEPLVIEVPKSSYLRHSSRQTVQTGLGKPREPKRIVGSKTLRIAASLNDLDANASTCSLKYPYLKRKSLVMQPQKLDWSKVNDSNTKAHGSSCENTKRCSLENSTCYLGAKKEDGKRDCVCEPDFEAAIAKEDHCKPNTASAKNRESRNYNNSSEMRGGETRQQMGKKLACKPPSLPDLESQLCSVRSYLLEPEVTQSKQLCKEEMYGLDQRSTKKLVYRENKNKTISEQQMGTVEGSSVTGPQVFSTDRCSRSSHSSRYITSKLAASK